MAHNFSAQHKRGLKGEEIVSQSLQKEWNVITAQDVFQRQEIDLFCTHRTTGEGMTIQVKTDYRAEQTGNAFIETIAYDFPTACLGWVYTCRADWIYYLLPKSRRVLKLKPEQLQERIEGWKKEYRTIKIPNIGNSGGYFTHGVLVPLRLIEGLAKEGDS